MAKNKYQIPCQKIISGGQTGVDRGALDACIENNFNCGGWCPKGRRAENGNIPKKYPLKETKETEYAFRTIKNVIESDGTLIITNEGITGGTLLTQQVAAEKNKPVLTVFPKKKNLHEIIKEVMDWISENNLKILNIAGPRQSEWADAYVCSKKIVSEIINQILFLKS